MATKAEKPKSDKAKADEAPAEDGSLPRKKSKKKLILLILLALLLVGGGGAAIWYALQPKPDVTEGEEEVAAEEEGAEEQVGERKPPVFVTLENFLVNLRDDDGDHYLQLGIVFEVSDQQAVDEVKLQMPRVRNGILLLLSSKQSKDIATLEGKQQLAEQIAVEARKPMSMPEPNKGIESVYFSNFVIQ
ncbi:MAG TPA: flagellar basal body-associated protein FliL [Burkholderiales bacterium]|nr:flagellar basal body-associated protein FliL [Burkholderiales bacterium]